MRSAHLSDQSGVTLIELLIGLVIMGMVTTSAFRLLQQQDAAFSAGSARMDVVQNYRFAAEILERNIRNAGANTAAGQPFLVYAGPSTITINADYTSSDPADAFAVYVDPSATAPETGSMTPARRVTLPGTGFAYPDSLYRDGAVSSSAETITFYFAPDTTSARADDHALYRQVNDLPPETVARGLIPVDGEAFFTYQELVGGDTVTSRTAWVPDGALPLTHQVAMHYSAADTGAVARIDGVRAVRVAFTAMAGRDGQQQQAPLRRLIRMPNAGQRSLRTCGERPLFSSAVTANQPPNEGRIEVTWNPSFDESSGESDVVRYAIFRRLVPDPDWGEPHFSIPAGQPSYVYSDASVSDGSTYQYAIAAQDCTPSMSDVQVSPQILVNTGP